MSNKKPHYLVLSEKPSLSRTVEAVYKKHASEYDFTCEFMSFAGHLCALKEPGAYDKQWEKWDLSTLPIIPDKFGYVVGKGKTKLFNDIKKEIKTGKYDGLINNCDGDAEGQAIFHTNMMLMNPGLPYLRLWPHDLTEQEVHRAFLNLRDEKEDALVNLTHRALLRAQLDWLIGMNGSRAFALTTKSRTAIGRVQTPTLKLIVDRELEIRNFVPQEYFILNADFKHKNGNYVGTYFNPKNDNMITDKKEIEKIQKDLTKDAKIKSIEKKQVVTYAPALFSLTTLQQEANNKLGFSAQDTLNIAQSLYEAKLISYPRTESTCVTDAIAKTFKTLLNSLSGTITTFTKTITDADIKKTSANKKYVDDKKVGSHYALIPTTESITKHPELSAKQKQLYELIVNRFVAIFLPASISDKTTVVTDCNGHLFKTNGSVMVELGYLKLLGYSGNDAILPDMKEKDAVEMTGSKIESKFTTPPARYNDATLIKAMETAGKNITDEELKEEMKGLSLGTPATRAGIIERLLDLKVVQKQKKVFIPTDLGIWQIQTLGDLSVANVELTAEYEQKLTGIETGQMAVSKFESEMVQYIKQLTTELKMMKRNMEVESKMSENSEIRGLCPNCGSKVLENDKVYACEENCGFKVFKTVAQAEVTVDDLNKLLAGEETDVKKMVSGKGKTFEAKLKMRPDLSGVDFVFESTADTGKKIGKCPKCGKDVVAREGKFGKYYKCTECDFTISGRIADKAISEATAKQILTDGETKIIKGFKSKKGSSFDAKLVLDDANNVVFKFGE